MTICNMSIEGAARVGYVNPDETTFAYLEGRAFAPQGEAFERATACWRALAIRCRRRYDDRVVLDGEALEPTVTWGINPGQSVPRQRRAARSARAPPTASARASRKRCSSWASAPASRSRARASTSPSSGRAPTAASRIFAKPRASCAATAWRRACSALVVPGSETVRQDAEREGLHEIFREAGFEWRGAGCSMCLAMNPDRLEGREICASSSNRNFKGRQGSPTGRTLLMSPAMVAAAALAGEVVDVRRQAGRRGSDGMSGASRIESRHRPRAAACAATTSTPIGSSRRAI